MCPGENGAEHWIDRGIEAYGRMHLVEAAQNFEKAVTINPESVQARLGFGVSCVFLYTNGLSDAVQEFLKSYGETSSSRDEMRAKLISEQNSTNARRAEENLQKALELESRNPLAIAYLAYLYSVWSDGMDSLGRLPRSRIPDALRYYKRLIEIDPHDESTYYACGAIEYSRAFDLISASEGYHRANEEGRRLLGRQITPLLDDSYRNLLRSLAIEPDDWKCLRYLSQVKQAQAYVAETPGERGQAEKEAREWELRAREIPGSPGQPRQSAGSAQFTFHALDPASQNANDAVAIAFPPDPAFLLPPPPPPPLPPLPAEIRMRNV